MSVRMTDLKALSGGQKNRKPQKKFESRRNFSNISLHSESARMRQEMKNN
jgi:hypothetical protein